MVLLCRFGRQIASSGYEGMCRSAFNNTLITGVLQSAAIESLLKVVGLTSAGMPSPFNMFLFGAFAGATREGLGVVVDKIDVFNMKERYENPFQVIRFAITFFTSMKVAEHICHDFGIPVKLDLSVIAVALADYGLGYTIDKAFDPSPRKDDPQPVQ